MCFLNKASGKHTQNKTKPQNLRDSFAKEHTFPLGRGGREASSVLTPDTGTIRPLDCASQRRVIKAGPHPGAHLPLPQVIMMEPPGTPVMLT